MSSPPIICTETLDDWIDWSPTNFVPIPANLRRTWTHTICEVCWFGREPDRFPVQIKRDDGDREVDQCCFCNGMKVTRIYVREDPASRLLFCHGLHVDG